MEWLQANWLWVLLGLGVVWFLLRGGGCGMGGHGSHRSGNRRDMVGDSRVEHGAHDAAGPHHEHRRDEAMAAPRGQHGRHGCC